MDVKIKFGGNLELKLCDEDIINPDEIGSGYSLFILHDHGFVVCAVWMSNLQDAIDEAVDEDKMERYLIDKSEYADYKVNSDEATCSFLGNAGEPHDIDTLGYIEIAPPKTRSNCAELAAIDIHVSNYHIY